MKKKLIYTIAASSLLFATIAGAASCTPIKKGEYASGTTTIFCDDGFKNILDEEIEVFEYSYPQASIIPIYVSEGAAIDTLLSDGTQAIITSKELTKEQIAFMKSKYKRVVRQKCIAVDAVALITNKDNPVQSLSYNEIKDIMNGNITRWSQLAGNDTTKIKLVFDNAESSTVSYFKENFLPKDAKLADKTNSFAQENNAQVFDIVKKDPDALGIISVSWLGDDLSKAKEVPMDKRMEDYQNETDTVATTLTSEVNILKVSNPTAENDFSPVAYKPYQAYIYSGDYPLVRKIYMVSTGSNSTVLHSFYTFVTGYVGQKIISKTGILPYELHQRVVEIK
ncbi:MAG: substrate-binding domain-containing protein [Muribaculaceae bacterium]|nr:substrate-binding domain-containing protein [Muribaculaceae bacterium]